MFKAVFRSRGRPTTRHRVICRPIRVEALEDRTLLAVNLSDGFAGLGFPDSFDSVPPDTSLAVGPNHVVELINSTIAVFDKADGSKLFQQSLEDFFAPLSPGTFLFDPTVVYDEQAGRFFAGVLDMDSVAKTSFFEFAVSDSSSALDGSGSPAFTEMHKINTAEMSGGQLTWADYPRMGRNADAYVISFNMFRFSGSQRYDHLQVLSIDKSTVLDSDNVTLDEIQVDRNSSHFTMTPAAMHDANPGDPMWFVEEGLRRNALRVVRMTGVLSDMPIFRDFVMPVKAYSAHVTALQPGRGRLDVLDGRILSVTWRDDHLVAAHTVGVGRRLPRARWYEFDTSGVSPQLMQFGTIIPGSLVCTYFPSIEIGTNGDLAMTFMESSAREFMSMYVTGRSSSDPLGIMQAPLLVHAGGAHYSAFDGAPYQTGDFSSIAVDPVTGTSFWAANEYATLAPSENWGTWIAQFSIT